MVNKYSINDTQVYDEEAFMRVATLSVNDKRQRTIAKSLDHRFVDRRVFNSITSSNNLINEIYLNMDLDHLRAFSDDTGLFDSYVNSYSSFLTAGALNVLFINLKVGTNQLTSEDITCLNHILTWLKNDVYVMPTLQFDGIDRRAEMDMYSAFVKDMIECKNSMVPGNLNLGINVPSYYRYKDLDKLFKLYDVENTEPTFITVDFNRAGIDDTKRMGVVNTINRHFMEEGVEDYFLYGLNVRNYKKRQVNPVSDEMMIARSGFNAVGAPHYDPVKRVIPPTTKLIQLGVVFNRDDYCFHPLTEKQQMDRFLEWSSDLCYEFDIEGDLRTEAPKIRPVMKKYNLCMENQEFFDLSTAIRKSDSDVIKEKLKKGV